MLGCAPFSGFKFSFFFIHCKILADFFGREKKGSVSPHACSQVRTYPPFIYLEPATLGVRAFSSSLVVLFHLRASNRKPNGLCPRSARLAAGSSATIFRWK